MDLVRTAKYWFVSSVAMAFDVSALERAVEKAKQVWAEACLRPQYGSVGPKHRL